MACHSHASYTQGSLGPWEILAKTHRPQRRREPQIPHLALPASCLLPRVIDTAFLFVFSVRGKNALIYIKW